MVSGLGMRTVVLVDSLNFHGDIAALSHSETVVAAQTGPKGRAALTRGIGSYLYISRIR